MNLFKLFLFISSLFFGSALANDQFWSTRCSSDTIKKTFGIVDPEPLYRNRNYDWQSSIDGGYFRLIMGDQKKSNFLDPRGVPGNEWDYVESWKWTSFSQGNRSDRTQETVSCVRGKVFAYEMDYKGDLSALTRKLNEKYGVPKRELITDSNDEGWAEVQRLYSEGPIQYVILRTSGYKGKEVEQVRVAYINAVDFKRYMAEYSKLLGEKMDLDRASHRARLRKDTESGLKKLR